MVLRQAYRAGEKAFLDYAGPKSPVVNRSTGEVREAMVFVGVLGAGHGSSSSTATPAAARHRLEFVVGLAESGIGISGLDIAPQVTTTGRSSSAARCFDLPK